MNQNYIKRFLIAEKASRVIHPDLEKQDAKESVHFSKFHKYSFGLKKMFFTAFAVLVAVLGSQAQQYYMNSGTSGNVFPFNSTTSNKVQWIYHPGDFNVPPPGNMLITTIYLKPSSSVSPNFTNLTIKMMLTNQANTVTGPFSTGLTTVFFAPSVSWPGLASQQFFPVTLQTPFYYDGTSNIMLEISETAYSPGMTILQNSAGGSRRIWGNVSSATGSAGSGLMQFGFDMIPANPAAPTIVGSTSVCQFTDVNLLATTTEPNPTFFWILPNNTQINGPALSITNAQLTHSGLYQSYYFSGGDTSDTTFVNLVINPKPDAPAIPPGGITLCQFGQYTDYGVPGQNLIWYETPGTPYGSPVAPIINTQVPGQHTYYVSQTVNGCESDRALVVINVNQKPPPPKVDNPMLFCQYEAPRALSVEGQNLRYYTTPSGGIGAVIPPVIPTGYIDTFIYYISQTVDGCESDRAELAVYIFPQPNATILTTREYVCQYDTIAYHYYGNAPAIANYNWQAPGGTIVSGQGTQGPLVVRYDSPGQREVSLIVSLGSCASNEAKKTMTVRPAPFAQISAQDIACVGEMVNVTLIDVTPKSEAFNWNFDGGQTSFGTLGGPYGVTWSSPGTKVISLVVYNQSCPSLPVTDTIVVDALPVADILGGDKTICAGDRDSLSAFADPYYTYTWYPKMFFVDNRGPVVETHIQTTGYVKLEVKSPHGCLGYDSILVTAEPCCDVYFPDAFTPNGDGKNDLFRMIKTGNHEISSFRVVNRFGQTVFETASDDIGWDGRFGGVAQDMGTYYYYVKYKCANGEYYEEKGTVHLIR